VRSGFYAPTPDGSLEIRGPSYLIGANIIESDHQIGFEVFSKVHNFVKDGIGEIF